MDVNIKWGFFSFYSHSLSHFVRLVLFLFYKIWIKRSIIPLLNWYNKNTHRLMNFGSCFRFNGLKYIHFRFFLFLPPLLQQLYKVFFSFTLQNSFFLVSLKEKEKASLAFMYLSHLLPHVCAGVCVRECACTFWYENILCAQVYTHALTHITLQNYYCELSWAEWHLAFKLSKYGLKAGKLSKNH